MNQWAKTATTTKLANQVMNKKFTALHDEILGIETLKKKVTDDMYLDSYLQHWGISKFAPKPYKANTFAETVVGLLLAIGFVVLLYATLTGYLIWT